MGGVVAMKLSEEKWHSEFTSSDQSDVTTSLSDFGDLMEAVWHSEMAIETSIINISPLRKRPLSSKLCAAWVLYGTFHRF